MERDFDLIREILLYFEQKSDDMPEQCPNIEGYTESEIMYHLRLMDEAGLLSCQRIRTQDQERIIRVAAGSLTWAGHDFLDASRNSQVWDKAKQIISDKVGSVPFDAFKILLTNLLKEKIGL